MIRLFELRTEKGLSQREISKIFNISQGTYNNWENGKTQPSIEQLIQLAEYFGTSVDYLIGKSNDYYDTVPTLEHDIKKNALLRVYDGLSPEDKENLYWLISKLDNKNRSV